MLRRYLKKVLSYINLQRHVAICFGAVMLFALPWAPLLGALLPERFIGIGGEFFASLFLVPILLGIILFLYSRKADDLERRLRKYENE